jgi:hypothetical protein
VVWAGQGEGGRYGRYGYGGCGDWVKVATAGNSDFGGKMIDFPEDIFKKIPKSSYPGTGTCTTGYMYVCMMNVQDNFYTCFFIFLFEVF